MKVIHINVECFWRFEEIIAYIDQEKPDILSCVEATDGQFLKDFFPRDYPGELQARYGGYARFFPTSMRRSETISVGFGAFIWSRFPLIDSYGMILGDKEPTLLPHDHPLFSGAPKYLRYPYSWELSFPFLSSLIQTPEGIVRILSVHFPVSYECFETLQILDAARQVIRFLDRSQDIPTLLLGDFNIRIGTLSMTLLAEKMTHHTAHLTNTLSRKIHPLWNKTPDHPGLGIDHAFSKHLTVTSCEAHEVMISDHLPLALEVHL